MTTQTRVAHIQFKAFPPEHSGYVNVKFDRFESDDRDYTFWRHMEESPEMIRNVLTVPRDNVLFFEDMGSAPTEESAS